MPPGAMNPSRPRRIDTQSEREITVTDAGEVSVSLCGTSLSGQAAHIVTHDNPGFCGGS